MFKYIKNSMNASRHLFFFTLFSLIVIFEIHTCILVIRALSLWWMTRIIFWNNLLYLNGLVGKSMPAWTITHPFVDNIVMRQRKISSLHSYLCSLVYDGWIFVLISHIFHSFSSLLHFSNGILFHLACISRPFFVGIFN